MDQSIIVQISESFVSIVEKLGLALVAILPTIVGGVLAFSGTYFSSYKSTNEKRREEKMKKLDELCDLATGLERFETRYRMEQWIHGESNTLSDPLYRMQSLVGLYFPEMKSQMSKLIQESRTLRSWVLAIKLQMLSDGLERKIPHESLLPSSDVINLVETKVQPLLKALRELFKVAFEIADGIRDENSKQ